MAANPLVQLGISLLLGPLVVSNLILALIRYATRRVDRYGVGKADQ